MCLICFAQHTEEEKSRRKLIPVFAEKVNSVPDKCVTAEHIVISDIVSRGRRHGLDLWSNT